MLSYKHIPLFVINPLSIDVSGQVHVQTTYTLDVTLMIKGVDEGRGTCFIK